MANEDLNGGNTDILIDNLGLDGNKAHATNSGTGLLKFGANLPTAHCERIFVRRVEGRGAGG
jgi:hypothetical protein